MAGKKKPAKKEAPKKCLRQIDTNTVMISDAPEFPEVTGANVSHKVPKGMTRVDPHTVVKTSYKK
jgi:hypothetical protein